MWVSTRAQYGMRALVEVALSSEPTSLKVVSDRQGISQHYLEQIIAVFAPRRDRRIDAWRVWWLPCGASASPRLPL